MRRIDFRFTTSLATVAGLATVALSSSVFAQEICADGTCPVGHECQIATVDCSAVCAITADGGVDCETPGCVLQEYAYCTPARCESDADCGDGMVCHTFQQTVCSTEPACAPGTDCGGFDDETECERSDYSQCAFPQDLPCETDAECGDGYECVASQACWCTGSAGDSTSDSTQPAPSAAVPGASGDGGSEAAECGCEPTGTNHCERLNIDCSSDADCPASWSCIAAEGPCWMDSAGNSGCSEGTPRCYPPASPEPTPGGPTTPTGEEDSTGSPTGPSLPPASTTPVSTHPEPGPGPAPADPHGNGSGGPGGAHGQGHHGGHTSSGHHFGFWGACSIDHVGGSSSDAPWALSMVALGAAALLRRRRN